MSPPTLLLARAMISAVLIWAAGGFAGGAVACTGAAEPACVASGAGDDGVVWACAPAATSTENRLNARATAHNRSIIGFPSCPSVIPSVPTVFPLAFPAASMAGQ